VGRVSPLRAARPNMKDGANGVTRPTSQLREEAKRYQVLLKFIDLFCGIGGLALKLNCSDGCTASWFEPGQRDRVIFKGIPKILFSPGSRKPRGTGRCNPHWD
jgi:hypothetical protein